MKVKEAIEILSKMDQDAVLRIRHVAGRNGEFIDRVPSFSDKFFPSGTVTIMDDLHASEEAERKQLQCGAW